jgi:hypothetical protein
VSARKSLSTRRLTRYDGEEETPPPILKESQKLSLSASLGLSSAERDGESSGDRPQWVQPLKSNLLPKIIFKSKLHQVSKQ